MPAEITCPSCKSPVRTSGAPGKRIRCPECDEVFTPGGAAPTKPKAAAKTAPSRPARRYDDDDEDRDERTKPGGINPVYLIGGLAVLAALVLLFGGGLFVWQRDRQRERAEVEVNMAREAEARQMFDRQQNFAPPQLQPNRFPVDGPPVPEPPVVPEPPAPEPPKPEKPPVVPVEAAPARVRPAFNPAKIAPTKAADKAELKLPGAADSTCFGGGGRYVIFRVPSAKQIAVLDVCEGKIAKYLPLIEEDALVAAGNAYLFVVAPTANVIQRWSLTTFEKELTIGVPIDSTPKQVLMGHATDGPLFIAGGERGGVREIALLDTRTLKKLATPSSGLGRLGFDGDAQVRVSADGRVFGHWTPGRSPSGLRSLVLSDAGAKAHDQHTSVGVILPGPDGTLFTAGGLFTPELKPIGPKLNYDSRSHPPIPAAHGNLFLTVTTDTGIGAPRKPPRVALRMVGDGRPLVTFGELTGLDVPKEYEQADKGLHLYDRVFLVPDAKAMAVLHATADKVTIHALDAEALMDKAGIDYLFVSSRPPGAVRGETFTYKPEVKSRKGGVKLKLDAGPNGMALADGTLTWAVPENFAGTSANVILTVSDSSGQETLHVFALPIAPR